jgi:hypothetical protein
MVKNMGSERKKGTVTLSPFGRNTEIAGLEAGRGRTVPPKFDWKNAAADGGIIAALTFFTTLGGVTLVGVEITSTLISAAISAAAQFFLMLAIKRGLRQG